MRVYGKLTALEYFAVAILAVAVPSCAFGQTGSFGGLMPAQGQAVGAKDSTTGRMQPLKLDGTGALVTTGGGGGGTVVQGNAGTAAQAWYVRIVDAAGVNVAAVDGTGALSITGSISATNPSVSATGAAVPASATYAGMNVAGNLTGMEGTANGLKVDGSAVTQPVESPSEAQNATTAPTWSVQIGGQGTTGGWNAIKRTPLDAGTLSSSTIADSGLVTAAFLMGEGHNGGTVYAVSVLPPDSSAVGSPGGATRKGPVVLPVVSTAAAPTYNEGRWNPLSTDLAGALRTTASGTVTANQGTSPWVVGQSTAANLKTEVWGGAKGTTTALVGTMTAAGANNNALDVLIRDSTGAEMDLFRANDLYTAAADHGLLILGQDAGAPARYRALKVDATGSIQVDVESMPTTTVTGATTPSDAFPNPTTAVTGFALLGGWNGATWDRIASGGNSADAEATRSTGVMEADSYNRVFNGTTWDRLRGTTTAGLYADLRGVNGTTILTGGVNGSQGVGGLAADGAAASGNPVQAGGVVVADGAITAKTAGNASRLSQDTQGRTMVRTYHPNFAYVSSGLSTATTLTQIVAAPGASLSIYITDITFSASVASTTTTDQQMTLKYGTGANCGTGTTYLWGAFNGANGGAATNFQTPIKVAANNALCWIHAATGSKIVNVNYFIAP